MRKIFISIPWFHPAFRAGGPVQSLANLVQQYSGDAIFYIFTSNTDLNGEKLHLPNVDAWVDYNARTKVFYATASGLLSKYKAAFKQVDPDVLFTIGLYSYPFNIYPLLLSGKHISVISVRGMLHPGALSQKSLKKKLFIRIFKLLRLPKRVFFHATDETEAAYIQSVFGGGTKVFIAGNFPRIFEPVSNRAKVPGSLHLITLALISPMKNHLLVLETLAGLQENITYDICGPVKDLRYWEQCKEKIKQLPANIRVNVYGDIPPDRVEAMLHDADVFIMPSLSENFGHSIFEALSAGLPVITSRHTPWNNLFQHAAGFNIGFDVSEMGSAIRQFAAMDEKAFNGWRTGAEKFAHDSINLADLQQQYTNMFSLR